MSRLDDILTELEQATDQLARVSLNAAQARHEYELARAKALLKQRDGTVAEKEARALEQIATQHFDYRVADSGWDALRVRCQNLRALLDGERTRAANERTVV